MKTHIRFLPLLLSLLLTAALCAVPVSANSAEPPGLTVLVLSPPEELELFLRVSEQERVKLEKKSKLWEDYYQLYHSMSPGDMTLGGLSLMGRGSGTEKSFALPRGLFSKYNNLVTLDWKSGSVSLGQPAWRTPLLVALRVGLTLLIEGAVFWLMGYRKKGSLMLFLLVNLVTQTGLNLMINGPDLRGYWFLGFLLAEIVIIALETAVYLGWLKEREKARAAIFGLSANVLSAWIGGWLIQILPV